MGWLSNLKVRMKIVLLVGILMALGIGGMMVGIISIGNINNDYGSKIPVIKENIKQSAMLLYRFAEYRRTVREEVMLTLEGEPIGEVVSAQGDLTKMISGYLDGLAKIASEHPELRLYEASEIQTVRARFTDYFELSVRLDNLLYSGDIDGALELMNGKMVPVGSDLDLYLEDQVDNSSTFFDKVVNDNYDSAGMMQMVVIITLIVGAMLALLLAFIFGDQIVRPILALRDGVVKLAGGDLSVQLASNRRDEFGDLGRELGDVVNVFSTLERNVTALNQDLVKDGDIDARLNQEDFKGDYRVMCDHLNGLVDSNISDVKYAMGFLSNFANGVFDVEVSNLPGKKAVLSDALLRMRDELKSVNGDVKALIEKVRKGNLDAHIDTQGYEGGWLEMTNGLNDVLDAFIAPIRETMAVAAEMAEGHLSASVKGSYQGEFLKLKNELNTTIRALSAYVSEISSVLESLADENLNVSIHTEFTGDFSVIKDSLTRIITSLNMVLSNINSSSEQVATGSHSMSSANTVLAQGATQQSEAIENLKTVLNDVNKDTTENVGNATKAKGLAESAKTGADTGMDKMNAMLAAMNDISVASNNISKIIKVIEDISFQTNLLALNAAVEAARAGQHGKGFTVVAGQVRSLAGKSRESAEETRVLIESTAEKVAAGMQLANTTSGMLKEIVMQIGDISEIINGVTDSSNKQAASIQSINDSIGRISDVVQSNTATSEEVAASTVELMAQADALKTEIGKFILKDGKGKQAARAQTAPSASATYSGAQQPSAPRTVLPTIRAPKPVSTVAVDKPKPAQAAVAKPATNVKPLAPAKPKKADDTVTPQLSAAPSGNKGTFYSSYAQGPNADYNRSDYGKY